MSMIAENERLRRQTARRRWSGSPDLDDVARQADEIIQRARDEAARVVAEARERTAAIAGASAAGGVAVRTDRERAAVDAFLTQERDVPPEPGRPRAGARGIGERDGAQGSASTRRRP